jgi:lysyl-tRNA synthetase class 2
MIQQVAGKNSLNHSDQTISLQKPWQRLPVNDAFQRYTGMSAQEALEAGQFDLLLVEKVEPELGWEVPVFLYDYPIALASLARPKPESPDLAERFELYIAGIEVANGFSELTDPVAQRCRFEEEIRKAQTYGRSCAMPDKFLTDLENLPACAGIALGLDRLFMLLLEQRSLAEALSFAEEDL